MKKLTKDSEFPKRFRSLIVDRLKISQADFCKKHGITSGYLSMILSGKRGPSADLIAEIYLNYSEHLTWLITGEDTKKDDIGHNNTVILEHQDLIKRYTDPVQGKEINEQLIDIQDTDKTLFQSAVNSIKSLWDTAMTIRHVKGKKPDKEKDLKNGTRG